MKNLIFSLLLFISCIASTRLSAQKNITSAVPNSVTTSNPEVKSRYEQEAIFLKNTFWGTRYVKNGVDYKMGFMAKNLGKEFADFPEAKAEYDAYRKKGKVGQILGLVGIGIGVVGLTQYVKRAKKSPVPDDVPPNAGEGIAYLGGIGLAMTGAFNTLKSTNHLQKAIFLRNKALAN
jgi:hypothetical protein